MCFIAENLGRLGEVLHCPLSSNLLINVISIILYPLSACARYCVLTSRWWGCCGRWGWGSRRRGRSLWSQSPERRGRRRACCCGGAHCCAGWPASPSRSGCGCWPPSCPSPAGEHWEVKNVANRTSSIGRHSHTFLNTHSRTLQLCCSLFTNVQ